MRKGNKGKLEHKVFSRLASERYDELNAMLKSSRHRTMSSLIRDILMNRKILIETYDPSLDKVMEELCGIRKELQAIGININQVTRRFHNEKLPGEQMNSALEIAKLYQQTDLKVSELFSVIAKLSEKWLPE